MVLEVAVHESQKTLDGFRLAQLQVFAEEKQVMVRVEQKVVSQFEQVSVTVTQTLYVPFLVMA